MTVDSRRYNEEKDTIVFDYCTDLGEYKVHKVYNEKRTGFDESKTFYTDISGTIVVSAGDDISILGVQEECPDKPFRCVKWSSLVTGLDNTGTRFNASYTFLVTLSDGSTETINQTPTIGWTNQLNQWVSLYQSILPEAVIEARCNITAGCGGLLPPPTDINFNLMRWRYMQVTACPTYKAPVKVEVIASSIPSHIGKVLDLEYFATPEVRGYECLECAEEAVLYYSDGSEVPESDKPICVFDCAESFPQVPQSACSVDFEEAGCDTVNDPDPNNWITVFRRYVTCDGGDPVIEYYIEDNTDPTAPALIEYVLVGDFVDCNTGDPVPEPTCETEIFAVEQRFDYTNESITVQREFISINFSPAQSFPNGSSVTYNGITLNISDGQLFDERPDNDNSVSGSISWIGWLQSNFPDGEFAFVPTSGQDSTWACRPWSIDVGGTIVSSQPVPTGQVAGDTCIIEQELCIPFQLIKERDTCSGVETYRYVTEGEKNQLVPYEVLGEILLSCPSTVDTQEDCGQFTGNCMCYGGSQGSTFTYNNADNSTDISFSMNTSTIKWSIELGQESDADSTGPFIADCISGGNVATMQITDSEGNIVNFEADTLISDGSASGGWAFTGVGIGGFSGKVSAVTIVCGSVSEESKACQWISCDKTVELWYDGIKILSEEEVSSLTECIIPVSTEPECEITIIQSQGCADETIVGEATIGDLILTVAQQDCNNILLSSTQYNITVGNTELTSPVLTTNCDPDPDITQTQDCILDSNNVQWTEITIVQGSTTTQIYINQDTLELGIPSGEISSWSSCSIDTVTDCRSGSQVWLGATSAWIGTTENDPEVTHGIVIDGERYEVTITNSNNISLMIEDLLEGFNNLCPNLVSITDTSGGTGSQIEFRLQTDCCDQVQDVQFTIEGTVSSQQSIAGVVESEDCSVEPAQRTIGCKDDRRDDLLKKISDNQKCVQWETIFAETCKDDNYPDGTKVWWKEGTDCEGNVVYPKGDRQIFPFSEWGSQGQTVSSVTTLAGFGLVEGLATASYSADTCGMDPNFVTGLSNQRTWVNMANGSVITGQFPNAWSLGSGNELVFETQWSTNQIYAVELELVGGTFVGPVNLNFDASTNIGTQLNSYQFTSCSTGSGTGQHFVASMSFSAFGLTPADQVIGIRITQVGTSGDPDFSGAYITDQAILSSTGGSSLDPQPSLLVPVGCCEECETYNTTTISCAAEDTLEVSTGDPILTITKYDCDDTPVSITQYDVNNNNTLLTVPVFTEECSGSTFDSETLRSCIRDTSLEEWTEIAIVNNGVIVSTTYYNNVNLEVGTPVGDSSLWTSCEDTLLDVTKVKVCVESIELDGQTWLVGAECNGFPSFISTTTGQTLFFETVTTSDWAIALTSNIVNCTVDAGNIIGVPSTDPTTLSKVEVEYNQHTSYSNATGDILSVYYTDLTDTTKFLNLVPVTCSCCPVVQEHYACVNGVKTQILISLNPSTLTVNKAVNAIDFTEILNPIYVDACDDCIVLANRSCQSYSNPFLSNYQNWVDIGDYDGLKGEFGFLACPIRNNYLRVIEFTLDGVDQLPLMSQTVFGGYPLVVGSFSTALNDITSIISSANIPFTISDNGGSLQIEYNDNQRVTFVLQEGFDDCVGGVDWATSAYIFVSRSGISGDSIESSGVIPPTNFDSLEIVSLNTYNDTDICNPI